MRLSFSYTEAGKAMALIQKVTLDLIKSRRESGQSEKVLFLFMNVQAMSMIVQSLSMVFASVQGHPATDD